MPPLPHQILLVTLPVKQVETRQTIHLVPLLKVRQSDKVAQGKPPSSCHCRDSKLLSTGIPKEGKTLPLDGRAACMHRMRKTTTPCLLTPLSYLVFLCVPVLYLGKFFSCCLFTLIIFVIISNLNFIAFTDFLYFNDFFISEISNWFFSLSTYSYYSISCFCLMISYSFYKYYFVYLSEHPKHNYFELRKTTNQSARDWCVQIEGICRCFAYDEGVEVWRTPWSESLFREREHGRLGLQEEVLSSLRSHL